MDSCLMTKEDVIRQYFCSWLKQDINLCKNLFAENAMYSECYGPIYRNKREILTWFRDWNKEGKVLEWPIKKILIIRNAAIVEWYFKCNYHDKISEFDGVSLIEFDIQNKIKNVKEFQSKSKHYYPYS